MQRSDAVERARTRRWTATGVSNDPDPRQAGATAAAAALGGDDPKLLIVFASQAYDLAELLSGVGTQAGGVPVIGCSTSGEIAATGPVEAGVVIMALGGSGFSVETAAASAEGTGLRGASAEGTGLRGASAAVASSVARLDPRPHRVLLLLSDGLGGDQQEVVRGAFGVVGAEVPLVGGCAGDDLKMQRTFQLYGSSVLEHAVVGAAIGSDAAIGIGVQHGWQAVGQPMVVTESSENRVISLDEQPALDAYLKRLDAPELAWHDAAALTQFAMTHPLGLSRRCGDEVRFVAGGDLVERTLACIAAVPQGSMVRIMEGGRDSVLDATGVACRQAVCELDGRTPVGLLAFDCVARKGVLGDDGVAVEVAEIAAHAPGAPVAGFYTYGEIARTRGVSGFHNQTLVVVAFS